MNKPPVVMIHGAFCGSWVFDDWRTKFEAAGYTVATPTLRHHDYGMQPPHALGTTSMLDYQSDLEALLKRLGEPAVVVGHSLGGLLGQMLAQKNTLRALVLLAPSAPWGMFPSTPHEFLSHQGLYLAGDFWHQALEPRRWIAVANALDRLDEKTCERVFARFVPESGLATFETLHWMLDLKRATFVDARSVTCPILAIAGARDRVNPAVTVRRLARRYGGRARYEELPEHSHWLIGEPGWEKIVSSTLFWLGRVLSPADANTEL